MAAETMMAASVSWAISLPEGRTPGGATLPDLVGLEGRVCPRDSRSVRVALFMVT